MKKLLILALCLVLMLTHASALAELSAGDTRKVGFLTYTLKQDGTWAVTWCEQEAVTVSIPLQLEGRPVTAIEGSAFGECWNLEEITIPEGITAIAPDAFYMCAGLKQILLPASLTQVPGNPFPSCGGLTDIQVAPGNPVLEVVDGALFSKPDRRLICYPAGLTELEYAIPEGTRIIGEAAFYLEGEDGCGAPWVLKRVIVPEGVTVIGDWAFYATRLASIQLPESLLAIGKRAFTDNQLGSLYISKNVAYLGEDALSTNTGATMLVEPDSYALSWCRSNGVRCAVRGSAEAEAWKEATVANCDEWVSLRAEASSKSERLAQIPLDAKVEVQYVNGEFYPCRYGGQTGYVLAKYIQPEW